MTAGTVVITGGILATVILLCIIAVLCYCRLQVRLALCVCLCLQKSSHTLIRANLSQYDYIIVANMIVNNSTYL